MGDNNNNSTTTHMETGLKPHPDNGVIIDAASEVKENQEEDVISLTTFASEETITEPATEEKPKGTVPEGAPPPLKLTLPDPSEAFVGQQDNVKVMTLNRLAKGRGYMCIGDVQKPFGTFEEAYNHFIRNNVIRMKDAVLERQWIEFLTLERQQAETADKYGEVVAIFEYRLQLRE